MLNKPLKGGCALITGASAGIGEAFAREFASKGFNLILVARRADKLEQLGAECTEKYGVDVHLRPCDLLAPSSAEDLYAACSDIEVDVLINNAGLMYRGPFSQHEPDDISALLQLNVVTLSSLTRLFLPPMLKRRRGRILNVTSTVGFHASPSMAVYAASKAYILSLTETLSVELHDSGVLATAFCPGPTDTEMVAESYGEELRSNPVSAMLMLSSREVAKQGYKACMTGDAIAVPGVANHFFNTLGRLQPRWLSRRFHRYLDKQLADS
ncbi:MAG: SDR family oxidoreductase [Halioglobus sp.]